MAIIQFRACDLSGEEIPSDTPTTRIYVEDSRGDISVELDMSDTSFKEVEKALRKILAKARPIEPPKPKTLGGNATEVAQARAWAIASGMDVKDKGQLPKHVIVAYRAHLDNTPDEEAHADHTNDPQQEGE